MAGAPASPGLSGDLAPPPGRRQAGLTERAPFPIRQQTLADLAAARFGLLAWLDPFAVPGSVSPFWPVMPMLPAWVEAWATPLVGDGLPRGLAVEGLRLLDRSLVLKLELNAAAVRLRLAAGCGFDPEDGVVLQHDLRVGPKAFVRQLEEACALAAGNVPRKSGGRATGSC